jgi:hypothetical protein
MEFTNCAKEYSLDHIYWIFNLWIAYSLYQNKINSPESKKNIITIDSNLLKTKKAITNFKDAGVSEIIEIIEGNAMEVLKQLSNNINESSKDQSQYFDFIFLDADKEKFYQDFQILITQGYQEHKYNTRPLVLLCSITYYYQYQILRLMKTY